MCHDTAISLLMGTKPPYNDPNRRSDLAKQAIRAVDRSKKEGSRSTRFSDPPGYRQDGIRWVCVSVDQISITPERLTRR